MVVKNPNNEESAEIEIDATYNLRGTNKRLQKLSGNQAYARVLRQCLEESKVNESITKILEEKEFKFYKLIGGKEDEKYWEKVCIKSQWINDKRKAWKEEHIPELYAEITFFEPSQRFFVVLGKRGKSRPHHSAKYANEGPYTFTTTRGKKQEFTIVHENGFPPTHGDPLTLSEMNYMDNTYRLKIKFGEKLYTYWNPDQKYFSDFKSLFIDNRTSALSNQGVEMAAESSRNDGIEGGMSAHGGGSGTHHYSSVAPNQGEEMTAGASRNDGIGGGMSAHGGGSGTHHYSSVAPNQGEEMTAGASRNDGIGGGMSAHGGGSGTHHYSSVAPNQGEEMQWHYWQSRRGNDGGSIA